MAKDGDGFCPHPKERIVSAQESDQVCHHTKDVSEMMRLFHVSERSNIWECPVGDKGERLRIFLTDLGYKQALESEGRGEMKVVRHARVSNGDLFYDTPKHGQEME